MDKRRQFSAAAENSVISAVACTPSANGRFSWALSLLFTICPPPFLALGKPVVAPRAPGIESYFDKNSLVLFDLGDPKDLAAKLAWVATNPYEAFETTKRGQVIYKEHAWSREREKLLDIGVGLLLNGEKRK